jgi:histone H3/H4
MDIANNIRLNLLKKSGISKNQVKPEVTQEVCDIIRSELQRKSVDVINKASLITSKKTLTQNDIHKAIQLNGEHIV